MDTDIDTAAAGNTLASVNLDPRVTVLLRGDTGTYGTADLDTFIAAYAVVICEYNTAFHIIYRFRKPSRFLLRILRNILSS